MNTKKITVVLLLVLVAAAFFLGIGAYRTRVQTEQAEQVRSEQARLVRMHSPVLGAQRAPVTIVEFFDPACEACRAFYPYVKRLLAQYPDDVRLVIRYAPLHEGSDEVVKLLEAARLQDKYQAVLEAVLASQPAWADHAKPNPALAFKAAEQAGLDIERAAQDVQRPELQAIVAQDVEDLQALKVNKTPTFFVNGRTLPSFGPEQLSALVAEEVAKLKK
ncbi:thioredoxin domain-containing protein [Ramlibacter sp. AW1]|uniref:Thioredoxin domain-containing protein n=1 Tax=Ramlibacter aurantiacus TaxID=2801330 RepID=A0A936ZKG4_9BURK|nr:thioredoxin domain-containing protein [Ramlibacter aurantiacus]MBL0422532.1 thioredoxin domain-containing protein [Ramlibacter aurantiacus]